MSSVVHATIVDSCPMCHTPAPVATQPAKQGGEGWRCVRCGQRWDARRLAAVAAYAAWAADHDGVDKS